ncbi:MAG: TolC family protein [Candidatus Aminicenantes bacterium]|nr:TolC family protein [Candidatus Aminicenantes bacterium]NIM78225.1 TolC family protein [Candidatus Aminicenantes bacterium]NIN23731.1 TolC family protein [Candidatus Aminicenantes bacterium]NIN47438.1 TolC family protein [Candidatus Aminicenantes bacterium]NIN90366.1 TolC family protein [Candidatus Aminicenantes bacterium]
MKKLLSLIMLVSVLVSPGFMFSQLEEPMEKKLTLKDAIFYGLKNNLDLQIQKTAVQSNWESLRIAKSIYIPTLNIDSYYGSSLTPSTNVYDAVDVVESQVTRWRSSISQMLPFGGTLSFGFNTTKSDSNSLTFSVNPSIDTNAGFNLSQPLLKNFGLLPTKYNIYVSANNHNMSELQLRENIIQLVYSIESAYWELVYAHQSHEATKVALQRAKDLLKQNQVKEKVGTIAPIDVLSSKAQVARNESSVISAERIIQIREETLKNILNMSKENVTIVPTDTPEIESVPVDFKAFLLEALENRPDIKRQKINLKTNNLGVRYYKNQTLPNLRLDAGYSTYGQGGTEWDIDYNLDPLDPNFRTQVEERTFMDSLREVLKMINKNYYFQFTLQVPIGFKEERARLAQARINLKRALLELKNTENNIYKEVKDIIKELESNRKLVEAERVAMQLVGENLRAEEKKLSVGLSTNFNVQEYQRQLADAETSYLRAVIDYTLSLARLNQVLARTFKTHDIKLDDYNEE